MIRTTYETGQQPRAMFDATIVMEKARVDPLDQSLELWDLMSPTADVQTARAAQTPALCPKHAFLVGPGQQVDLRSAPSS